MCPWAPTQYDTDKPISLPSVIADKRQTETETTLNLNTAAYLGLLCDNAYKVQTWPGSRSREIF